MLRRLAAVLFLLLAFMVGDARSQDLVVAVPGGCGTGNFLSGSAYLTVDPTGQLCEVTGNLSHAATTALANNLTAKAASGNLFGFNCTAITGGAAGFCVAYNGAATPGTGSLTGANVLDFCYFDTTARGCSLSRIPASIAYNAGIQILITSAASPYTYTTGTDTGAISADYQ